MLCPVRVASCRQASPAVAFVGDAQPVTFTATAVQPYDNIEWATPAVK